MLLVSGCVSYEKAVSNLEWKIWRGGQILNLKPETSRSVKSSATRT